MSITDDLDVEFSRYLQIMQPYLCLIQNRNIINTCNEWIQKLSEYDKDKVIRNKYVFRLCYQLAKGEVREPFINPPLDLLPDLNETELSLSDISIKEECALHKYDFDKYDFQDIKPLATSLSNIDNESISSNSVNLGNKFSRSYDNSNYYIPNANRRCLRRYDSNCTGDDLNNINYYGQRTFKLINKLRDLKKQNILLSYELNALKEKDIPKNTDKSRLSCCYKNKLLETEFCINNITTKLKGSTEILNNIKDINKHPIEYNKEISNKTVESINNNNNDETINEDQKYIKKLKEIEDFYENQIKHIKKENETILKNILDDKQLIIREKDKIIIEKESEIKRLENILKDHIFQVDQKSKIHAKSENESISESMMSKVQYLEKRLNKMEKLKIKNDKKIESHLATLRKEKHINECSLQLELLRQRAHLATEIADRSHIELKSALDTLENKYKHIIDNMQAANIRCRLENDSVLESIIQKIVVSPEKVQDENYNHVFNKKKTHTSSNVKDEPEKELITHYDVIKNDEISIIKNFPENEPLDTPQFCLQNDTLFNFFDKIFIPQKECT